MAIIKQKGQRVGVFIDAQNLYHSAKNLYHAKVNFESILEDSVAGRTLVRAIAYVITTETGEEKSFFDALKKLGIETKAKDLQIKPPNPNMMLGSLSGGNQQKVALAKWLTHLPKVLILSEPTRGMDVGAKEDVIRIVKDLRDRGVAILVLSTEPETILTLADRVSVLRKGRVAKEFNTGTIHKADLLAAA